MQTLSQIPYIPRPTIAIQSDLLLTHLNRVLHIQSSVVFTFNQFPVHSKRKNHAYWASSHYNLTHHTVCSTMTVILPQTISMSSAAKRPTNELTKFCWHGFFASSWTPHHFCCSCESNHLLNAFLCTSLCTSSQQTHPGRSNPPITHTDKFPHGIPSLTGDLLARAPITGTRQLGHNDLHLVDHEGFDLTGLLPESHVFNKRIKAAAMLACDVWKSTGLW